MEPDHHIGIVGITGLKQRLHIPLVALPSLAVVCLEDPQNPPVSQFDQIVCHQITAHTVIHQDVRLIFHLRIVSLYEDIGNLVKIKFFIQCHIGAENLTLAGFHDQTVDIFLQDFLETAAFLHAAVAGIFQDNAVSLRRQYAVNALDQPGENIVRQVRGDNRNIPRPPVIHSAERK